MEPVDFNELLRRGARETLAADLGTGPSETARPADEKPTVTAYKTDKKGYGHWEIRRITHASGTPDYYQHRDRHAKGEWKHGLPEGLKKADMVPVEAGSPSSRERKSQARPEQGAQPTAAPTLETAATTPEILEAVAQSIRPGCPLDDMPDSETLATWVTNECPSDARATADALLMATWKRPAGWLVSGDGEPGSQPRRMIACIKGLLEGLEGVLTFETLSIAEGRSRACRLARHRRRSTDAPLGAARPDVAAEARGPEAREQSAAHHAQGPHGRRTVGRVRRRAAV